MNEKYEPCSICEEYIEGVICDKDKCPVGKMKKELDRLQKLQKPTGAGGYRIENGKVIFYSNMLNGYRHEYINLEEIVSELNLYMHTDYKNIELISHYQHKTQTAKAEAIKEFAERLKNRAINNDDGCGFVIIEQIDNLVKELTESVNYGSSKTEIKERV